MKDHHLISANRLDDGAVVWLNDALEWVDTLELACAFDDERLEGAKLAAEHAVGQNLIVGPTPRAAQIVEGLPLPIDYREQLRSRGPSVRPDLGKQAESAGVLSTVRERPVVPVEVAHAGCTATTRRSASSSRRALSSSSSKLHDAFRVSSTKRHSRSTD